MLRKVRQILALVFFLCITLLFLDFTGTVHAWFGWMAKIQFMPALFAANAVVLIFLFLLTLILGRVYCSVICPLGVMQDVVSRIGGNVFTSTILFAICSSGNIYRSIFSWGRLSGSFIVALQFIRQNSFKSVGADMAVW